MLPRMLLWQSKQQNTQLDAQACTGCLELISIDFLGQLVPVSIALALQKN